MIDLRNITKQFILERIDQKDIFKKYFQIVSDTPEDYNEIIEGKLYKNPLRVFIDGSSDKNVGCAFNWDNRGMLKFNDFAIRGRNNWSVDCFNIVQILYDCNFMEALHKIYEIFNLIENDEYIIENIKERKEEARTTKSFKEIKVKIREWNNYDINYWSQYFIDKELLQFYNVYPVLNAWVGDKFYYGYSTRDLCYVFFFGNSIVKLYFPLRSKDKNRFIQNNGSILQGSQQLPLSGEFCLLTKSYKDVIALSLFDIPAVAGMSETVLISKKQHSILISRFDNLFTLFDYDKTGIRNAVKHKMKYEISPLMFNKNEDEKDFSDNLKKYGINHMSNYIEQIKKNYL